MHLSDIMTFKGKIGGGVSLGLTRRCPLSCAHCSTNSTMNSEQLPAELFVRFVESFTPHNRPDVLAMSGGEALLRPGLVQQLAEAAALVGCRTMLLSGLFFATARKIPQPIHAAIAAVDHFSVSIDTFHEREVPREAVFRVLDSLLAEGTHLSLHIMGTDAEDPYLSEITQEVERRFDGAIPMLVNGLAWFGRAREWMAPGPVRTSGGAAEPCPMIAWPVVGFDGTVVACSNDDALDRRPAHLRLGHIASDDWETIRSRCLNSPAVRAVRAFGPEYLAQRYSSLQTRCSGYCGTCLRLSEDPDVPAALDALMKRPAIAAFEQELLALQAQPPDGAPALRHGLARYARLISLGAPA